MSITLPADVMVRIERRLRSGQYATVEDVITAGLRALEDQEELGDFAPGELLSALREAEDSLDRDGGIPADAAFAWVRERAANRGVAEK